MLCIDGVIKETVIYFRDVVTAVRIDMNAYCGKGASSANNNAEAREPLGNRGPCFGNL